MQLKLPDTGISLKDTLSSLIRATICAAPNHTFYCADFSAIEARVLLWLVGDDRGLEIFKNGQDIYLDMASSIFRYLCYDKQKHAKERQLGKTCILGLGYGMGHKRFKETCEAQGVDLAGLDPEQIVRTYREKYRSVRNAWYRCEEMAITAVCNPDSKIGARGMYFIYETEFKSLRCYLLSGRFLSWPEPIVDHHAITPWGKKKAQLKYKGMGFNKKWAEQRTYGGSIVESMVQGIARDFLTSAMIRIHDAGFKIVMHVHDEIVIEQPEDEDRYQEFLDLMSVVPEWGEGVPIEVEGWQGKRYRK